MTGCWLPPLGYTRQDLSIQGGHQYCWCNLLLNSSGHKNILHKGHLWCSADISYWWRRCILIDFRGDTNFHQYRLILQQPGRYLPHTFWWSCVYWTVTLLGLHQLWVPSERLIVMSSKNHESRIWEVIPFLGGDAHHDTAWLILNINQCFCSPLPSGGLLSYFAYFIFWIILHPFWVFFCVYYSLLPA